MKNSKKGIIKGLPMNFTDLEEPFSICIFNKATKITKVTNIDVSKFSTRFMLQMYFSFFNVEIICGFTSNVLAVYFDTSYPYGFPSRITCLPIDKIKFLVNTLINQDKKVSFVWVH